MKKNEFYVWRHPTLEDVDLHVYPNESDPYRFHCRAYEYEDRELNYLSRHNYSTFYGTLDEAKEFALNLVAGLRDASKM